MALGEDWPVRLAPQESARGAYCPSLSIYITNKPRQQRRDSARPIRTVPPAVITHHYNRAAYKKHTVHALRHKAYSNVIC
ncbi:unnamed protein product [Danaus chrysippus]|uniref:(African queen) hypothetical protein n=1 Tax=Danaus chrysippus TaxID=151541 RepID=A0A8J2QQ55_9NEOP|nr:unnamed protein product [Danaus chrysippus]